MTSEVFANSPVPGRVTPIAVLANNGGQVSSSATSFVIAAALPTALQTGGQFHALIDSELVIVPTQTGTTLTGITRGVERSTASTHLDGAAIYPLLTAGALANALASIQITKAAVIATGLAAADIGADAAGLAAAETTRAQAAEALKAPIASPTFTGVATSPAFAASGLTGATAGGRYVGTTASGAPVTGTFALGDWCTDQTGARWTCTVAGSPGTWAQEPGTGGGTPGGDASGTLANLTVNTVQGGKTPVNLSSFLGFSQVVRPSGDATGATDLANINAALAGGTNTSVYLNGSYVVNGSIVIPSGMTLVLADAYVKLANATNKPIITNPSYDQVAAPAASSIHVRGIGRAILDYNGANQTAQPTTPWVEASVMFCNVSNFSIEGIQTQNNIFVPYWFQACSNGRGDQLHHEVGATDLGFIHADIGCSNISFSNLTANGTFPDSVFSMNSVANSAFPAVSETPYAHTLTGSARNISGLSWSNIRLSSSTGMFNCFLDAGGTCTDIDISNVHNTYSGTLACDEFNFGPPGYHLRTLPAQGSVSGWRVNGYTMGGQNHFLIGLDNPMTDMQFTGIRVGGNGVCTGLIGNFDTPTSVAGYFPQVSRIKVSDVDIPTLASGGLGTGALMAISSGVNAVDISIENVHIGTANGPLLKNATDIMGMSLSKVRVGTLNANPFQNGFRNEGGVVRDIQYVNKGTALTAILPSTVTFKIGQPFPALAAADATPLAVHGSEIQTFTTKDPTGGSATTGGRYVADGKNWTLIASGNSVFRPSQIYLPLLFHYDAAVIGGSSDGVAMGRWPDLANNIPLVQPTAGKQPLWHAADAHLNGLPSVGFNGTSMFMQNTGLSPLAAAQPFTFFIVYYFTALVSQQVVADLVTLTTGSDGPKYYMKDATHTGGFTGGTSVANTATVTANTAYVACFTASLGTTLTFGENKAAYSSLFTSAVGGTKAPTGVTFGSVFDGSSSYGAVNIAEAFCYQGLVTSSDYALIAAALAAKYAVTLT